MNRIRRSSVVPDSVSMSKNHCNYPLVFPATKEIRKHTLSDGSKVTGIGDYNKNDALQYVIGFGNHTVGDKEISPLTSFDGQILFGLLASLQIKNRKFKKDNPKAEDKTEYSIKFESLYSLLKFLKISTTNPFYYDRAKEALIKIKNTSLYFSNSFYDSKIKKKVVGLKAFNIFSNLSIIEEESITNKRKDCLIKVTFEKDYYMMHDAYFVMYELSLLKILSEPEFNLQCVLDSFKEVIFDKGLKLTRDVRMLCRKIGYKDKPLFDFKRQIEKAIKKINTKCNTDYKLKFEKEKVIFSSKKGCLIKRLANERISDIEQY